MRDLPELAVREAIVNGVAHREWALPEPTVVEHVGRTTRVTSSGGLVGGVTPRNIITHPSQSPNETADDVNALLLPRHLVDKGWLDVRTAAPLLQLDGSETPAAIGRLAT